MAEPTIIANMGEGETGKSDSIKRVYEKLCEVADDKPDLLREPETFSGDVCAIITINDVKVGIVSHGDVISTIKSCIDELISHNCEIILASCRNSYKAVCLLKSYYNQGYRIWRTSNARLFEEDTHPRIAPKALTSRFNENWATEIANLIEAWCYAGKKIKKKMYKSKIIKN